MSPGPTSTSWDAFLPQAFHWIAAVERRVIQAPKAGAWHLLGLRRRDKDDIEITAAQVPAEIKERLLEQCRILGWKGQSPTLKVVLDQTPWLLSMEPDSGLTSAQKGRQIGMDAAVALGELGPGTELVLVGVEYQDSLDVIEGLALGWYDSSFFKGTTKAQSFPRALLYWGHAPKEATDKERATRIQAALLAKALQDAPSNWLDPERFVEVAQGLLAAAKGSKVSTIKRSQMQELGMGAFLSVAQGSTKEAILMVARIKGKSPKDPVALVGKGVTFDAGGINLKPSAGLEEMKFDMSGAAGVLGAAYYFSRHEAPVDVICAFAMVENMPSGTATRPGDVVKSLSGKTIEVINTDAEGRLVLCDAITYVLNHERPKTLYCIATLTGAVIQALGHCGAAYMTDDQAMAQYLEGVSLRSGEPLWRLPLWPEIKKEIKSKVADLKNLPKVNVMAGSIVGGAFLAEFLKDQGVKWAHIDIAGTAWSCAATGFPGNGGSSFGVRTLIEAVLAQAQ